MTLPKGTIPVVVGIVAAILACGFAYHEGSVRAEQRIAQELELAWKDSVANATKIVVEKDTVFQHDTVTLSKVETQYATLHDTVLRHIADTIYVKEFVEIADSTIGSCTHALKDCGALTTALQHKIRDQDQVIKLADAQRPNWLQRHQLLLTLVTGAGAGYVGFRVGR